jgi:hypothetical protein
MGHLRVSPSGLVVYLTGTLATDEFIYVAQLTTGAALVVLVF